MSESNARRSFLTTRPVAIFMVFVAATVFGLLSYERLPLRLMPKLSYPTITVRTQYPGAAPETVENEISRPIEEVVGVVPGLERISSVSRAGISDVVLEFSWDEDVSDASQAVLEKLDQVFLPAQAKRPLLLHYDPSEDPILELSLTGNADHFANEAGMRRLRRIADLEVKRRLEAVKGVAAVRVRGGLEEEIHVLLDERELVRTGISVQTIIDRLAAENVNLAGGTVKDGRSEYMVRTLGEYESLEQIGETIVGGHGQRALRIADLGHVVRTHKEVEIATRTDGKPAVQIEVFKEADANIVAVAHRVKSLVGGSNTPVEEVDPQHRHRETGASLAAALAEDEQARLVIVADRSLFIESSIRELRGTALLGGLLAILVLLIFLKQLRPTMIVAASIPVSLAVTFAPLKMLGVSLNIMSLGGLALGIGMLVDSSIVVLESIHRCREEGDSLTTAVERGTCEVRSAVIASTLTSIAVFLPMVFISGVAGQAFGSLGLAVVISLLASLVVALFLVPMLASLRPPAPSATGLEWHEMRHFDSLARCASTLRRRGWLRLVLLPYAVGRLALALPLEVFAKLLLLTLYGLIWFFHRTLSFATRVLAKTWSTIAGRWPTPRNALYPRVIRSALNHPVLVLMLVTGCLALSWQILSHLSSELLPEVHQGELTVEAALPIGTPLEQTTRLLEPVERAILEEEDEIASLLLTLGYDSATSERSDEGEHTARFKLLLKPGGDMQAREARVAARLRQHFASVPDLDLRIVRPVLFSAKTPIEVVIHGDDLSKLKSVADEARQIMAALPSLADVESSLRPGAPEIQVIYQRQHLARMGLRIGEVARLVRDKVKGYEATRFKLKRRRIPIIVRLAEGDRENVKALRTLVVNPGGQRPVRLSAIAAVKLGEGPSEVRRIDGQRSAVVSANLGAASLSTATAQISRALENQIEWPLGMSFTISGQQAEWEASRRSLWLVLALSVFLVYVIMASQFESLLHPLVIMLTIPLAFVGSLLALWLLKIELSVVVFLGMIMLAGIVVNNAIVLVDYINTLRQRGLPRDEAIVTAGQVRLRPILMTTATTVLGLVPMALGLGDGAEIRTPMAVTVIAGLISSTLLTLIVVPTVYALLDSLAARLLKRGQGARESSAREDDALTSTVRG